MRIILIILVLCTLKSYSFAQRKLDIVSQIMSFELKSSDSDLLLERNQFSKNKSFQDRVIIDLACAKALMERSEIMKAFDLIYSFEEADFKDDFYLHGSYLLVKARLSYKLKKVERAALENNKAYQLFKTNRFYEEQKLSAINQGFYRTQLKDKNADIWFKRAHDLSAKTIHNEVLLYSNWAFFELYLNYDIQAGEQLMKAFDKSTRNLDYLNYQDQYRRLVILTIIEEMKGNLTKQEEYLAEAQKLSEEYHMNDYLRDIYNTRSIHAQQIGDNRSALNFARKTDSISRLLPNQKLSEKSIQIEMDKKLTEVNKRRRLIQENLAFQQKLGLISIVFAVVVLSGFFWIFRLFQKNKSKTKILLKQNLELVNQILPPKNTHIEGKEVDLELIQKLEDYVVNREAFKQNGLNLEKIAKKLNTNRTYLSEAINAYYAMNFNTWLNEIRIHEARKFFADEKYKHFSIEGIAKEAGFTSISVFNSAFKRETGLTPSQFRSGIKKS